GVRLPVSRVDGAGLTSLWVGMVAPAAQPYRVSAVAGGRHLLGPAVIAGTGAVDGLLEDAWQQLPDLDPPPPPPSSGVGSGTTRRPGACPARTWAGSARRPVVARTRAATWW